MVKKNGRTALRSCFFHRAGRRGSRTEPTMLRNLKPRQRGGMMVNPTPRDGSGWTRCGKKHTGGVSPSSPTRSRRPDPNRTRSFATVRIAPLRVATRGAMCDAHVPAAVGLEHDERSASSGGGIAAGQNPNPFGRSRCRRSAPRSSTRKHQANNPPFSTPTPPPDEAPSATSEVCFSQSGVAGCNRRPQRRTHALRHPPRRPDVRILLSMY